jgi:hypothetical protein
MPPLGNPGEYAVAFELMYPSEADRATLWGASSGFRRHATPRSR